MTDAALQSLGDAALAANQPAEAVAALDAYSQTTQRPALLLLRGEAREQAGKPLDAVADYQAVYLRFATSEQARQASTKLGFLRSSLGANYPPVALDQRLAHAAMLFGAKSWNDARNEYADLMPRLSGADRERAQLRILECGVALGSRARRNGGASNQRSRCGCRTSRLSRGILSDAATGIADGGSRRRRGFPCAVEPLGRIRAFPGRKLLLGAARSRSRGELLQTARGKFPDVDKRACRAVARRVGRRH